MKYIFFTLMLLVFPAIAQEPTAVKSDTARLFNELKQVRKEKKEVVDSMKVLAVRIDSTKQKPPVKDKKTIDYRQRYDVDKVNGERVTWYFNYHIRGDTDTIFLYVTKEYSRWDY